MAISPLVIGAFLLQAMLQVVAFLVMPHTAGFTKWVPSAVGLGSFIAVYIILARIVHTGVSIGTLTPFLAAFVPIVIIATSVLFFGETASWPKIGLLVSACVIIGFAGRLA